MITSGVYLWPLRVYLTKLHSLCQVTLEDLYNGKSTKLAVQRNVICSECNGIGGKKVCLHGLLSSVVKVEVKSA